MDKTRVFSDLLPIGYANQIENDMLSTQVPWYYINDVTNKNYGCNSGFVHVAYDFGNEPSTWYPFLKPITYQIESVTGHSIRQLLRIRVGLLTRTLEPQYQYNTPHLDFLMPHYTACYYVNDSDGDTVLFNQVRSDMNTNEISDSTVIDYVSKTNFTIEQKCTPRKNSLCVFDGWRFHSSTKPRDSARRIVITINYIAEHQNAS